MGCEFSSEYDHVEYHYSGLATDNCDQFDEDKNKLHPLFEAWLDGCNTSSSYCNGEDDENIIGCSFTKKKVSFLQDETLLRYWEDLNTFHPVHYPNMGDAEMVEDLDVETSFCSQKNDLNVESHTRAIGTKEPQISQLPTLAELSADEWSSTSSSTSKKDGEGEEVRFIHDNCQEETHSFAEPSFEILTCGNKISSITESIQTSSSTLLADSVKVRKSEAAAKAKFYLYQTTLPSVIPNQPIHLKITEDYLTSLNDDWADQESISFSYDPSFNFGQYTIETADGMSYGEGGLKIRTNTKAIGTSRNVMTLENSSTGRIIAAIRSRKSSCPSHIIYGTKPNFLGQIASSFQAEQRLDGGSAGCKLYPWALVRKEGQELNDSISIHMLQKTLPRFHETKIMGQERCGDVAEAKINGGGSFFEECPTFKSKRIFNNTTKDALQTHTIVTRTVKCDGNRIGRECCETNDQRLRENITCCVVVHDPQNYDVLYVTIAPGIDPIMMICYLAAHSKMDLEPKMHT